MNKPLTRTATRKLGWTIKTRNIGPSDWVHYGAFIYFGEEPGCREFLSCPKAMWDRADAIEAALKWIEQNTPTPA